MGKAMKKGKAGDGRCLVRAERLAECLEVNRVVVLEQLLEVGQQGSR
jgi:hypothetical protein